MEPTRIFKPTQKINTFLWFDSQAEEAAHFYTSVFPNSKVNAINRYGEPGPGPKNSVMTVVFELAGIEFVALNGGPHFTFTEAISLVVNCESQQEVDELWEALSAGGDKGQCGWLKDKFGLSWQIVPTALIEMLQDEDAARRDRVMAAMLQMQKLEVAVLEKAYEGEAA